MSGKTPTVDKLEELGKKLDMVGEHLKKQDRVIARNQKTLTKHIETLKPYIEGADFLQKVYKYTKWAYPTVIAAFAAYLAFRTYIKNNLGI